MTNITNGLHFDKPKPPRYHRFPPSTSGSSEDVKLTSEDYERLAHQLARLSSRLSEMEKLSRIEIDEVLEKIINLKHDVVILVKNCVEQNAHLVDEMRNLTVQFQSLKDSVECGSKIRKMMLLMESNVEALRHELEDHLEEHPLRDTQLKDSIKLMKGKSEDFIVQLDTYLMLLLNHQRTVDVLNQSRKRKDATLIPQMVKLSAVS
jgi:hypothetical protein